MAKFNPPTDFPFDKPTEWPDWKQRFVRYRTATKLNKEDGDVQVSCLIYAMGSESENIYRSFTFAEDRHRNDFDKVIEKFDEYFVPRRNVIHERACFHQRVQRTGEKAETFIRALYELSEHCEFGASRDEVTHRRNNKYSGSQGKPKGGNKGQCGRCGKAQHNKDENCPAKKSTCNACHKVGHWGRVCRSK